MKDSSKFLGQDDPLCGKCSRLSGGCCVTSLEDTAYCFPLSEPEIQRLIPHAHLTAPFPTGAGSTGKNTGGIKGNTGDTNADRDSTPKGTVHTAENTVDAAEDTARLAVCSPEPNSEEFVKSMGYLFPAQPAKISELFPATSFHYRLRLNENGACIFLGEEGCSLPRGARPWYCLLFPAWFQSGELTVFISDVCLATRDTTEPLLALQRLDVSERAARDIFNRLIADWGFTDE